MPRAAFPSGRKSLLLLALIVGGVWWWQRPPPEPVFQGTRLSEDLAEEILDHGSSQARIVLFDQLYDHFGPGGKYAEPAIEAQLPSVVAIFIRAFHDPDPKVRAKAAYSLGDCKELRDDDDLCYDPAFP